jgi:molybdopterin-guanine dinucleotide biosynthesis protein A
VAVPVGAVVLAGGRSSRMGTAKAGPAVARLDAAAPHGGRPSAASRTARVVVVRAPGQPLPSLPSPWRSWTTTSRPAGPLHGMAVGLGRVAGRADVGPGLLDRPAVPAPGLPAAAARAARDADVVLPVVQGHRQPLVAGYRTALADRLASCSPRTGCGRPSCWRRPQVRAVEDAELLADARLCAVDRTSTRCSG